MKIGSLFFVGEPPVKLSSNKSIPLSSNDQRISHQSTWEEAPLLTMWCYSGLLHDSPTFGQEVESEMKLINNSNKSASKAELQYSTFIARWICRRLENLQRDRLGISNQLKCGWKWLAGCLIVSVMIRAVWHCIFVEILCSRVEFIWNCVKGRARDTAEETIILPGRHLLHLLLECLHAFLFDAVLRWWFRIMLVNLENRFHHLSSLNGVARHTAYNPSSLLLIPSNRHHDNHLHFLEKEVAVEQWKEWNVWTIYFKRILKLTINRRVSMAIQLHSSLFPPTIIVTFPSFAMLPLNRNHWILLFQSPKPPKSIEGERAAEIFIWGNEYAKSKLCTSNRLLRRRKM